MRDFLRHGSLVLTGTLAANALFYLSYAFVQRGLGVENAGLFMALLAATQLLAIPGSVLATVVAKISGDESALGHLGALRSLSTRMTLSVIPLLALTLVASTIGNAWFRSYFRATDPLSIIMAAAAFTLFFPLAPQRAVFQGGGRFRTFVASGLIESGAKRATGVALLAWGGGIRFAFGGFAIAAGLSFAYNTFAGSRLGVKGEPFKLPPGAVRRHLVGVVLPIAGLTAITFADAILVRHYLSPYTSGLYAIVALVGRAIVTITQFVPTVLMPKATKAAASGNSPAPLLFAAAGATAVVVLPILAIVGFFPGKIAGMLAGGAFSAAAPLMLPYAIAMSALAGATVLATYLIGIGRRGFAVPMTLVCASEIVAVVLIHPSVVTVVHIVLAGHLCAFGSVLVATLLSLKARPRRFDQQGLEATAMVAAHLTD